MCSCVEPTTSSWILVGGYMANFQGLQIRWRITYDVDTKFAGKIQKRCSSLSVFLEQSFSSYYLFSKYFNDCICLFI